MQFSKPFIIIVLIVVSVLIGIGIERYWLDQSDVDVDLQERGAALEHALRHLDLGYACPMHSDIVSKQPGSCPICGMDLIKREPAEDKERAGGSLPEVVVTPEFIHNFGVRTATVERGPVSRRIVALGRVSRTPQAQVTSVPPGLKGKIASISEKAIGDAVNKGEWLYSIDSQEWRDLQQFYLDAIGEEGQIEEKSRVIQLKQRLQALGMNAAALARLLEKGQIERMLGVNAPVSGTIAEWHAGKGEIVDAASKVISLGGVNRIPIIVSLFEGQGAWVHRGQRITVRVPTIPGAEFEGQVDRRDREINFSTRTLPVYAGFSTSDPRITYGMLVEVTIQALPRENVLRIPREALIRTGNGSRVIVARGNGRFQPVIVMPGIESGDLIEILSGLDQGEEIVVSGQFLIDSESSLKANFQRMEMGDDVP